MTFKRGCIGSTTISMLQTALLFRNCRICLQAFPIYRIVLLRTVRTHFLVCLGTFYYRRINILYRRKQKQEEREVVKDAIVIWAEENIPILRKYIHSIKTLADKIKKSDEILPQAFPVQQITIDVLSQFTIDRLTDSLHRKKTKFLFVKCIIFNQHTT